MKRKGRFAMVHLPERLGEIMVAFHKYNIEAKRLQLVQTNYMAFFEQAITVLQTLVIALGAGLGIWGVIKKNLM